MHLGLEGREELLGVGAGELRRLAALLRLLVAALARLLLCRALLALLLLGLLAVGLLGLGFLLLLVFGVGRLGALLLVALRAGSAVARLGLLVGRGGDVLALILILVLLVGVTDETEVLLQRASESDLVTVVR